MTQLHANAQAPNTARMFVALLLPPELKGQIRTFQEELRRALRNPSSFRWGDPAQVHLTLKFLGDVSWDALPEVQRVLAEAASGIGSIELEAGDLGFFPERRRPRVCWIGVGGDLDRLRVLQENVDRVTAPWAPRETKRYTPHLTLARVKWPDRELGQALAGLPEALWRRQMGGWQVESMDLMHSTLLSQGASHTRLACFSLIGPS